MHHGTHTDALVSGTSFNNRFGASSRPVMSSSTPGDNSLVHVARVHITRTSCALQKYLTLHTVSTRLYIIPAKADKISLA